MFNICTKCILNSLKTNYKNPVLKLRFYSAQAKLKKHVIDENIRPLISCRRKEYDFYPDSNLNSEINKFDDIKYVSKGWHHRQAKGDYFIIHMSDDVNIFEENSFDDSELSSKIVEALQKRGITRPTNIQKLAIPTILSGRNTLLAAETGCGKTLAYLLPAFELILRQKVKRNEDENVFNEPLCLVLAPSRELASQIHHVAMDLGKDLDLKSHLVLGGGIKQKIFNPNISDVDLLVATPGAVSKLLTTGVYKTQSVQHVVLDEADTLLDDSFADRISHILQRFPFVYAKTDESQESVQLTLASATMPIQLPEIVSKIIVPESLVRLTTENLHKVLVHVPQRFLRLGAAQKPSQLLQLVKKDYAKDYPVIIFSNDSKTCDWVSLFLNENGIKCMNLNGDMHLYLRKDVFKKFQKGEINVISCTDIGSRGLDTTRVKHIINYNFPKFTADYLHRCGRTGRIGSPEKCHITNFISNGYEVNLTQQIELSVRRNQTLPKINGNISRVIGNKIMKKYNIDSQKLV